ncbi:hypothetical protein F9L16_15535 [Agarivorans sp. B2Z047]|uniref:hypothetical protein n=1 Tax=Agarivorans sp. B2Z047 TaxID=2652721 RepID=UPI00128DD82E|nr:hypothetical protein [Agarivorans sp. B2Z047]MPW30400.1 hypothetical protein [Agarivorans sp. B2Z047]UQN42972.1 hypothetical protein LQZ07_00425 [Agarivorans sp. B2Z047]
MILSLIVKPWRSVWVCLLLISPSSFAAIVNNNHLFQKTQIISGQLQAIRSANDLSELQSEPQIFADKLAVHLVFKTRQLSALAASLLSSQGLNPIEPKPVAYSVIRPRSVMPYLEELEQQLSQVMTKLGVPAGAEVERPLGKSVNDVYQQLVLIEYLFEGLVERDSLQDLANNVNKTQAELLLISQARELPLQFSNALSVSGRELTDVNIVALQSWYLLERLFRQLAIEPSKPGRLPAGESSAYQLVDTSVNILAELHRAKTILQIEKDSPLMQVNAYSDANQAYAAFVSLRSGLLVMVGAAAL